MCLWCMVGKVVWIEISKDSRVCPICGKCYVKTKWTPLYGADGTHIKYDQSALKKLREEHC